MSEAQGITGFYGKVPSRGDFVQRGLPEAFIDVWDPWLQQSIAASRTTLGDKWLDAYLTSPIWRFVLSSGVIDDCVWCGAMMPSVDRVNRYFPLTVAARLEAQQNVFALPDLNAEWYENVESLLLAALDDDGLDIDEYGARLSALRLQEPLARVPAQRIHDAIWDLAEARTNVASRYPTLLQELAQTQLGSFALWWTLGSDQISPRLQCTRVLPAAADYVLFLAEGYRT